MPSPFPGMDPWLESPEHWHNVHQILITLIAAQLNRILPEGFAATIDENIYLLSPGDRFLPDVAILRTSNNFATAPNLPGASGAVLTATMPYEIVEEADEVREPFVKVISTNAQRTVVTVIEVLSPINKTGAGREQYRKKQLEILESAAHLLEIDLLRGGQHTVAVEQRSLTAQYRGFWDYIVCLHRAGVGNRFTCWPVGLFDPLPTIFVPLTVGSPELTLDLGALFSRCYDEGPFRRTVDYSQVPTPRLKPSEAQWAAEWLKQE
ncbi:DUF4058 family protein [Armatimonas rosea]|uniref:DUF4058 family protein n=1 Tax=Armatimonas rosea TaxID=685828 RepID=A0A7W9W8H3_ARMRO|nr:DUF4058 family protein [Armatimonas rosea]MBB6051602.1 hypothetical protein [Armatimonas rosea]